MVRFLFLFVIFTGCVDHDKDALDDLSCEIEMINVGKDILTLKVKIMNESQKEIVQMFGGDYDKVLTTSDILNEVGGTYYHGASRYVGQRLSRLVNRGFIIRVKRGHYKLAPIRPRKKALTVNKDQLQLF